MLRAPGDRMLGRCVVVLLAAGALLVPAGPAEAVWAVAGTGSGRSDAVTLARPASATLSCASLVSAPKVSWAATSHASGYQIYRRLGAGGTPTPVAGGPYPGTSANLTGSLADVISGLTVGAVVTVTFMVQAVSGAPDAQHLNGGWKSPTMVTATPSMTVALGALCSA